MLEREPAYAYELADWAAENSGHIQPVYAYQVSGPPYGSVHPTGIEPEIAQSALGLQGPDECELHGLEDVSQIDRVRPRALEQVFDLVLAKLHPSTWGAKATVCAATASR